MPGRATAGTPAESRAAAFLAPSVISRGSAGVDAHQRQNAPSAPVASAATSAVRARPWRSAISWPTTAGTFSQNDRADVPVGCSYFRTLAGLLKPLAGSIWGASGLKQPQAIRARQSASGSSPEHHQPPAAATGSRGASRRASGRVAYCLAWAPSCSIRSPTRASITSAPCRLWRLAAARSGWMAEPLIHSVRWRRSVPSGPVATSQLLPVGTVMGALTGHPRSAMNRNRNVADP